MNITNSTVMLLRNKLIKDALSAAKINPSFKIALIIKTWNMFITGQILKSLKFDPAKENYPVVLTGLKIY
jgi:hypothetical protein